MTSQPLSFTFRDGPIDRNFELCALRSCHVAGDFTQPPYNLPYLRISIVNRKGWLRKANNQSEDDGPLESMYGRAS